MKTKTTSTTQQQVPPISPSDKYHQSITTLPLSNFIECQVDNNLDALIISGTPTNEELKEAWSNIQQEYSDIVGDMEYKVYLSLLIQLQVHDIDLVLINNCVQILEHVYIKQYADKLNKLVSADFAFDYSNPEQYIHELQRCVNRSKSIIMLREQKKAGLVAMEQKFNENNKKPTREYFYSMLNVLSDFAKYEIQDTITVYRFCDRIKRLAEYNKQLVNNNSKNNNGGGKDRFIH